MGMLITGFRAASGVIMDALPLFANAASRAKFPMANVNPSATTSSHLLEVIPAGHELRRSMQTATGTNAARNQSVEISPEMWLVATFCNNPATPHNAIGINATSNQDDRKP